MKKVIVGLFAISSMVSCTKECKECEDKECNPNDSTSICKPNPDSSYTCKTDLSKGLLAYYPFNGNFNDESGNGNTASAKNGAYLTADFMGRTNSCAGFDGVNDYLIVPGSSKLNSDTVTLSVQVMVNSANRRHTIVNRVNFENATAILWGVGVSVATDNKFTYAVRPTTEDCSQQSAFDVSLSLYGNAVYIPGRWYNITTSFAGGVQKLYINGVLQGTATRSFTKAKKCDLADLMIGGWWKNDIVSIDGKIDDVRLYNRLLNDCEISKLAETFKD